MNIFYVTMKSESTYKSMEYAQHSVEKYCNLGKYSNSIEQDCNAKQRRCQGWRGSELWWWKEACPVRLQPSMAP